MKQFELWWAVMPEPVGRRPVLLLSRSAAYEYLARIIVAEITTTIRGIPQEVTLGRAEGLKERSVANLDAVHVVAKRRLEKRIGGLAERRTNEVKRALGYALDFSELKRIGEG